MTVKTVVAISSLVMRGAVGLRAIVFALERRGHRVWPLPTVTMPWHPGLGRSTRSVPAEFATQLNELSRFAGEVDAVLTGYFANAEEVEAAARFIDAVRAARGDALVVVDPVTGDENGRYVPDAVAEAIVTQLLPRADIATPNVNELADLGTGDTPEARARSIGTRRIVVTSAIARDGRIGSMLLGEETATVEHAAITPAPRGTGDFFSAILTSAVLGGASGRDALAEAAAATLAVIEASDGETMALADAQDAIAAPPVSRVVVSG
ncbi:bifunctional hydroxymethylpyrimidine kinase/phosphomethylpyrimidine kinase [Acuticoccus sp. M5D2P5]|uniref:bifunctional hydroxymethylpyrimidine kinase/phosphomethylpyrimidine kinase n=1 Tax=Acuticoccus kalidii TaxID=2910977 RepID=UPI001F2BDF2E|nr:bifunctional hydroxymethylpyrimidine kinase/phosphomethylpyrimidine kinase [Acuticoccus kalidii]MCF3933799.1 bifunctional hydroxymethylpyrimidine kinase/phosphomethylpyrimidine kinase [Acuticoccus kalidii]